MKITLIILSLLLFSCKKDNCSCGEVTQKSMSYIWAVNSCSNKTNEFYVVFSEMDNYNIGQTYCNDKNFTW